MSDLASRFQSFGIAAIVYTDILRDGMETGVNAEATRALAEAPMRRGRHKNIPL